MTLEESIRQKAEEPPVMSPPFNHVDWPSMMDTIIREGARIITALGVILSGFWFAAQPYVEKVADERIANHGLAPNTKVQMLEKQLDSIETKVNETNRDTQDAADSVIELKSDVNTVKELLTEQRQDIKILLRSLNSRYVPPSGD